jgi:hypothetical protein
MIFFVGLAAAAVAFGVYELVHYTASHVGRAM